LTLVLTLSIINNIMKKLCADCYYVGSEKNKTPGNVVVELFLWAAFFVSFFAILAFGILPPIFLFILSIGYSLHRLIGGKKVCPNCKHTSMIPTDSLRAKEIIESSGINIGEADYSDSRAPQIYKYVRLGWIILVCTVLATWVLT